MNTTSETHMEYFSGIAGGSMTEGAGAIAAIILSIIGLAGVFADIVAPVAVIVIGAVFLMEGVWLSAAIRRQGAQANRRNLGLANGVSAGFFAGLAGIVLGILALFRASPTTSAGVLMAVAVLIYGAALLVGGGAFSRLAGTADAAMATVNSGSLLVGMASVVLGILAVIGLVPMTLVLVALLSLGGAALFTGSSYYNETATQ